MTKKKLILIIVVLWLIVTSLYAYFYISSILARREEFDAYAMNWQFQLVMFFIFRLPYMELLLGLLIAIVLAVPLPRLAKRKVLEEKNDL